MIAKFMNFFLYIWGVLRGDTWVRLFGNMIVGGLFLAGGGLTLAFEYESLSFSMDGGSSSLVIFGFIVTGLGIIGAWFHYMKKSQNPIVLYYGRWYPFANMDENPPVYALPRREKAFVRAAPIANGVDSFDANQALNEMNYIQASIQRDRKDHKGAPHVYLAALGSFPYLFGLGACFRSAHTPLTILEHDRGDNKWKVMPKFSDDNPHHIVAGDLDTPLHQAMEDLMQKQGDECGLALAYTFNITKEDIPEYLQNNTLILNHSMGVGHDLLANEVVQKTLLGELSVILTDLGKVKKKVHLFVSAQASICINMGKRYQDNAHGTLILHCYNSKSKSYPWAIEFNGKDYSLL